MILGSLNQTNYTKEDLMKIAVTGAHGAGKTTLSKHLSGRNNWRYIPESPFQALQAGFAINEHTSLETEVWIFARQAEMELAEPPWIADKCMIDLFAYADYFFNSDKALMNVLMRMTDAAVQNYETVVYCPIEFPIEDDGFRSLDPVFQLEIDKRIKNLLYRYGLPTINVTGSRDQRFAQVQQALSKPG